ncbi:23S rRNA (guanosine(2251)-2'-O)-methyltransferase RlmB [Alsobacter sp. SYSU M60028]|uniref:23S rRNA (Guanosine(2251)-2'-O)-methyltransferase RlmB n=1 Tax=Alsobacter ponti TaxID=2962936 RepID=A0ABT1LFX5_9HYPH|nr:23S rRNA (guanosine(2251)-2'-O)-methyltransferase RlmB [Alsobacter ponti]MCP8940402.1 23S rRNA (guanosine(2251)-2'-O)-methyltransferase RlmB [Alsobacter ponti]
MARKPGGDRHDHRSRDAGRTGGWRPEDANRSGRDERGGGKPRGDARPARGQDEREPARGAAQRRERAPEGRHESRQDRPERGAARPGGGRPLLYGFHSVIEALANPRRVVHRVYATENAAARLADRPSGTRAPVTMVRGDDIARLVGEDVVHQGLVAEVDNLPALDIHDLPADGIVLVLDQVTDPHNVGAILRSAAAFGVSGLVITERHSPEATGVLAKTASGGLEHVPLVTVPNLAQALTVLGERGFWRVGLDSEGPTPLDKAVATRPVALVLGAEGKGLRRLTRERCDALARLDVPGAIKSLNVSNAAAVALYALDRALAPKA